MHRHLVWSGWGGLLLLLLVPAPAFSPVEAPRSAPPRVRLYDGTLPLGFEPNVGQADPAVDFLARSLDGTVFLGPSGATLSWGRPAPSRRGEPPPELALRRAVRVRLQGASPGESEPQQQLPGTVNYLKGNDRAAWHTDVPTFARVLYRGVLPGVDIAWYGHSGHLEYDLLLAPGADPATLRLEFEGVDALAVAADGALELTAGDEHLRQLPPVVTQEVNGASTPVAGRYVLLGDGRVGVELGAYDATRPLVVDPVLTYSTYLGGSADDYIHGIAMDSSGAAYLGGYTASPTFPVTAGALRTTYSITGDAFVFKLNAAGTAVVWSTFMGGVTNTNMVYAIALDSAGQPTVAGITMATDFPLAGTAVQTTYKGGPYDFFVSKLTAAGSGLVYSTYLGGTGSDYAQAVAVDSTGAMYVAGYSGSTDFPVSSGAPQATTRGGFSDGVVAKITSAGTLAYSTYLGGTQDDYILGVAVDSAGVAYLGGYTRSTDFNVTAGAYQTAFAGALFDGTLARVNAAGTAFDFSTYFGGNGSDEITAIALDGAGRPYVTGLFSSSNVTGTTGAFQVTPNLGQEAFAARFTTTGTLDWLTFLGGSGNEWGWAIAVDAVGNTTIAGMTSSADFPIRGATQSVFDGGNDAYVAHFDSTGSVLAFSTFLGGPPNEAAYAVAVDGTGNVVAAGTTSGQGTPVTAGAFDSVFDGGQTDGIVMKWAGVLYDGGPPDAGAPDAGPPDAGPPDAGPPDAGPPDAGPPDAGPPDAGPPDAGPPDAGPPDAGTPDAGSIDAGAPDAGIADAGPEDAGAVDAGSGRQRKEDLQLSCASTGGAGSVGLFLALVVLALRPRRARR